MHENFKPDATIIPTTHPLYTKCTAHQINFSLLLKFLFNSRSQHSMKINVITTGNYNNISTNGLIFTWVIQNVCVKFAVIDIFNVFFIQIDEVFDYNSRKYLWVFHTCDVMTMYYTDCSKSLNQSRLKVLS